MLQKIWYGHSTISWLLLPLSLLYAIVTALRRAAYRLHLLSSSQVNRAVIVVGNISVGGTGKTPLVIWLANKLQQRGLHPAVITRGYGGASPTWPVDVDANSDPILVGDEAVLIAARTEALVVAGANRVADARQAIERGADVILSDDGLQHYKLARDFEIAVIDGARGFGNRFLLPAGPLRESVRRLESVDVVMVNRRDATRSLDVGLKNQKHILVETQLGSARSLLTGELAPLSRFAGRRVHAIAGIGNPHAFFEALRAQGLLIEAHPLADHANIVALDLQFGDDDPVLMTEKDAVKCRAFANDKYWSIAQEVQVADAESLLAQIEAIARRKFTREN